MKTAVHCTLIRPKIDSIDVGTVAELKQAIGLKLDMDERFVLDLSQVRFIDSSGVGAMLAIKRMCANAGKRVKIAGALEQVRSQFQSVGMDRLIDIHDTAKQAAEAYTADVERSRSCAAR